MNYIPPQSDFKKKALVYIRVSSEEQVENYSLGTQEEICRRTARVKGLEVVEVFREEGRSAKTIMGRPELLRLLDYCRKNKKEIGALIVYRIDRLSRQTEDFLAIRRKLTDYGIVIISANEPTGSSPSEKLLETVLAGFAQHDNDVRSERTKNGLRARFLAGKVTNTVPYGYINEKGYALKDPKTFDTYQKAWELMATGTKSLRQMRDIMEEWGVRISIQKVQHMFRNKFYMGILTSRSYPEQVKGQHIPMISEDLFYKVQAILDGRNPNKTVLPMRHRDNPEFPLRRIVRCGKCGTPFTAAWSKGRNGKYGYYFCRKRCTGQSIPMIDLDNGMKALLKEMSPTEQGLKLFLQAFLNTFQKKLKEINKRQNNAEDEIGKLKALRQTLVEKNLAGTFSDEIFKEQNTAIEQKLAAAYSANDNELINGFNIEAGIKFLEAKLKDLATTYEESTPMLAALRSFLGSIFLSGFAWQYPGYSKTEISPLYQAVQQFDNPNVSVSCLWQVFSICRLIL